MSDVGSWQPDQITELTDSVLDTLAHAANHLDDDRLGLDADRRDALQGIMNLADDIWDQAASQVSDEQVIAWIKALTLLEQRVSGFEAGANSPVIPLVACLRTRGAYPKGLTRWIKAHTDNRFLPYGSLLDRL